MTKNYNGEDKFFAGLGAVFIVLFGIFIFAGAVSVVIAIWDAGTLNFIVWSVVFTVLFFLMRSVYRLILNKEWM